ncbi:MAG: hypothetical protein RR923_06265 [Bacilli bacterium]
MHEATYELEYAVKELGLKGLKIHPGKLNIEAELKMPVRKRIK